MPRLPRFGTKCEGTQHRPIPRAKTAQMIQHSNDHSSVTSRCCTTVTSRCSSATTSASSQSSWSERSPCSIPSIFWGLTTSGRGPTTSFNSRTMTPPWSTETITWVAAYIMKSYVSDHWWTCAPWKPQKCWVPPKKNKNVKTVQIPQNLACIKGQGHSPQSLKTSVRSAAPFTHDHRTKWSLANDDRLSHQVNIKRSMTAK